MHRRNRNLAKMAQKGGLIGKMRIVQETSYVDLTFLRSNCNRMPVSARKQ